MSFLQTVIIAIGLAMDAFAVALSAGTSGHGRELRPAVRLAFHFGLFQFLMPVLGWFCGRSLAQQLGRIDRWAAFVLLAGVGAHMLWEAFHSEPDDMPSDPTRGLRMITLSLATSIDALAVGLSLALLRVQIWSPSVIIGLVTGALSLLGVHLGNRLRGSLGRRIELLGGALLILIGINLLFSQAR